MEHKNFHTQNSMFTAPDVHIMHHPVNGVVSITQLYILQLFQYLVSGTLLFVWVNLVASCIKDCFIRYFFIFMPRAYQWTTLSLWCTITAGP